MTIVDQKGKLLTNGDSDRELAMTGAQFEYTTRLEKSYIERIERLLEPMLGPEAVRAQVTADIDFTVSEQTQESFNPDTPALRSDQTTVEQSSGAVNGGIPGALSNEPPVAGTAPEVTGNGETANGAGTPSSSNRREIRNYELDKTISHTRFSMGRLHRLSVAVVVDDKVNTGADGSSTRMARTPEELDRLTDLVKKAVGFNAVRVSPRMVYVDASKPRLVEGFTRNTFTAMIEGVRESAVSSGLIDEATFDEGIRALYRTTAEDGVFCYTFFKAVATK